MYTASGIGEGGSADPMVCGDIDQGAARNCSTYTWRGPEAAIKVPYQKIRHAYEDTARRVATRSIASFWILTHADEVASDMPYMLAIIIGVLPSPQ